MEKIMVTLSRSFLETAIPTNYPSTNATTLFHIGLVCFKNNRFGFARTFWQHVLRVKLDLRSHNPISIFMNLMQFYLSRYQAKQCLAILEDQSVSIDCRVKRVLDFIK
jgi:hypothetical protein